MSPGYAGGWFFDFVFGTVIISFLDLLAFSLRLQDETHKSILSSSMNVIEILDAGIKR